MQPGLTPSGLPTVKKLRNNVDGLGFTGDFDFAILRYVVLLFANSLPVRLQPWDENQFEQGQAGRFIRDPIRVLEQVLMRRLLVA